MRKGKKAWALYHPQKMALAVCLCLFLIMLCSMGRLLSLNYDLNHKQSLGLGGPFALTAPDGHMVSDKDFRGKYVLIYFGYTSCPDICPTTMADLGIAMKQLGARAEEVQPLFITVDPNRDTPDVLKSYTSAFSPRLIGLTGSPQQIASVEKEFRVYARIRRTVGDPDNYSVDHSSAFYLLGPDGHVIAVLNANQQGDRLAQDISRYIT